MSSARSTNAHPLLKKKIVINPYTKIESGVINGFLIDFETFSVWEDNTEQSGLNLYYYTDDNKSVKCFYPFDPYFFVNCEDRFKANDRTFNILKRRINNHKGNGYKLSDHIKKIELVEVRDAEHPDHLFLPSSKFLKITLDSPRSVSSRDVKIREDILNVDGIIPPWREADINFEMRVSIDAEELIKIGRHYKAFIRSGSVLKIKETPVGSFPNIPCCSFDLETCKQPMKFPNPEEDPIGTIGAMFDEDGVIICNEDVMHYIPSKFIVGTTTVNGEKIMHWEDVLIDEEKFRLTHENCMVIDPILCPNEHISILTFIDMLANHSLAVAGYNSDNFDWQYVAKRLEKHGEKMEDFGFKYDRWNKAYYIPGLLCVDAYLYVAQHSRLPEGERGLKSATKKIFHFEPIDFDDEEALMRAMDSESEDYDPESVVYYNGSDIYCTQIFLKQLILPYFFSFTVDKPMDMFSISRRGNATICESGLLQRAKKLNILAPNKSDSGLKKGDLVNVDGKEYYVDRESYKGAVVELNSVGLYRTDWEMEIEVSPNEIRCIIDNVEEALKMELDDENVVGIVTGKDDNDNEIVEDMTMNELVEDIRNKLRTIIDESKKRKITNEDGVLEDAWFYRGMFMLIHADVASLYPSIIITYKIQPHSAVKKEYCDRCPFREEDPPCWYTIEWERNIRVIDATEEEKKIAKRLYHNRNELHYGSKLKKYDIGKDDDFMEMLKKVIKKSRPRFKKKLKINEEARFCQKAHGFFYKEVEDVRNDRYKYKYRWIDFEEKERNEKKKYKTFMETLAEKYAEVGNEVYTDEKVDYEKIIHCLDEDEETQRKLFIDTIQEYKKDGSFNQFMQEGKKAGLNSYYGYLKTIAVRWWSIVAAGSITSKGRKILLSNINYTLCMSQLLEADTDGYYIMVPKIFPVNIILKVEKDGKVKNKNVNVFSALLNLHSARHFTNHNSYEPVQCCGSVSPVLTYDEDGNKTMVCEKCGKEVEWENKERCMLKWDTDGPYFGMFVQKKKKYCVYGVDGIEVLKGVETKRNDSIMLQRDMINEFWHKFFSKDTKGRKVAYKKAEAYIRSVVKSLKTGEMPVDNLLKKTNISEKAMERINGVKRALKMLKKHGINDFSFSYPDMQFIDIIIKNKTGRLDNFKTNAIVNSMRRSREDPLFNVPLEVLQEVAQAYGGSKGINKGAQFIVAFREIDMAKDDDINTKFKKIDEYSSVSFVKSIYPSGTTYTVSPKGKISPKEIKSGKSEGMIPYPLLKTDPKTINAYIERWMGNQPELKKKSDIKKIIDFEHYVDAIESLAYRFVVDPAKAQGINIAVTDLFDKKLYGNRRMDQYFSKSSDGKKKRTTIQRVKRSGKKKDEKRGVKIDRFFS